jgi:antitoxin HicB
MNYPVLLTPDDNRTILVTCPDLPEVTTFGEDAEDALMHAVDAIEEALAGRIAHREDIPAPSPPAGRDAVPLPPITAAKVALYQAARAQGVTKAALGRSLGWHSVQVDRLFDLNHASRIEQIDQALRTMGKRLEIMVRDAVEPSAEARLTIAELIVRDALSAEELRRRLTVAERDHPVPAAHRPDSARLVHEAELGDHRQGPTHRRPPGPPPGTRSRPGDE